MTGALDSIRVLDMTVWQQGTSASAMLADLGADVVKIEEPVIGDPGRALHRVESVGLSGYFEALNRGKRSLVLDLKQPKGVEVLLHLAREADVFLTNFRPGVAERLGIGYADMSAVNAGIVYARASGYGPKGPDAEQGCFDILGQARGGLMYVTGDPDRMPKNAGAPIADQVGGMLAAFGICAALLHRERTGEGQEVDVSLLGSVMALQSFNITARLFGGDAPQRFPRGGTTPFWNTYAGSDGKYFTIAMLLNRGWGDICRIIGRPDLENDQRFASYGKRVRDNPNELIAILDETFATRPADDWVRELNAAGVFCTRVQDYDEIARDPQVLANNYIEEVDRGAGDPVRIVATPVTFGKTPARIQSMAPEHGQHTEEVLLEAGYSWEEIGALRGDGVVGPRKD